MTQLVDLGQGLEIRDASGKSAGVFVPDAVAKELRDEIARLKKEVERLQGERELYRRMVHQLERFTPEELQELENGGGVPFEQLVAEAERVIQATENG